MNERDELGDDLVPDYVTRIRSHGFYGWPWFYIGPNPDPRHPGAHPELRDRVLVPDVLIQSHTASLEMCFYTGTQFPAVYHLDAFAARSHRFVYHHVTAPICQPSREGFMTGRVPHRSGGLQSPGRADHDMHATRQNLHALPQHLR